MCVYLYVYKYLCKIYVICIYIYMYMYVCMYVCIYIYLYIHNMCVGIDSFVLPYYPMEMDGTQSPHHYLAIDHDQFCLCSPP